MRKRNAARSRSASCLGVASLALLAACAPAGVADAPGEPTAASAGDDAGAVSDGLIGSTSFAATLRTVVGRKYVSAEQAGGGAVTATRDVAQAWETFTLIDRNGGALESGDLVNVKTYGGYLLQADNGGGSTANAAGHDPGDWETFRVVLDGASGTVHSGDTIGLQTLTSGKWISAQDGGGGPVFAYGAALGPWERFTITFVVASPPPPPPAAQFAHVEGQGFVDGSGSPLPLRGVNLGNWLEPEGYMWKLTSGRGDRPRRIEDRAREVLGDAGAKAFWTSYRDNYTTEDDIAKIAALGMNHVRVPLNARLLLPEGQDQLDETAFVYVKNVVDWCALHRVYVVLDMHCAPGGGTGKNIDDSANDQPELFQSATNQDRFVRLWTELATRYADNPWVLGYDLLNEPLPESDFAQYTSQLYPLYQRVGSAIRQVDTHHVLFVEGANWANDWSTLGAPFDANMAYSFHKYWNGNDRGAIQGYLDKRAEWNRPIWVGETGENDNAWYEANFELLEANGVGWCFWPWKKLDSGNGPHSVAAPAGWSAFVDYVDNGGPKPANAQPIFDALATNVKLSNASYNGAVICSLGPTIRRANGCP